MVEPEKRITVTEALKHPFFTTTVSSSFFIFLLCWLPQPVSLALTEIIIMNAPRATPFDYVNINRKHLMTMIFGGTLHRDFAALSHSVSFFYFCHQHNVIMFFFLFFSFSVIFFFSFFFNLKRAHISHPRTAF